MGGILSRQRFHPGLLGMFTNPYFIIRSRLARQMRAWGAMTQGRLIDVGCGSRPYQDCFVNVQDYVGLDIDVSGHPDEKKCADIYYDGRSIPLPDGGFDVALTSEVFEHVFNAPELLAEIRRVLKPGGRLLMTLPFAFPEHEQPYDYARYTQFGIKALLEENGFQIVHIGKLGFSLQAIGQLFNGYVFAGTSRFKLVQMAAQLLVCGPVTLLSEAAGALLPKDDRLYCNLAIEAVSTKR